jgi:hypothetical protein
MLSGVARSQGASLVVEDEMKLAFQPVGHGQHVRQVSAGATVQHYFRSPDGWTDLEDENLSRPIAEARESSNVFVRSPAVGRLPRACLHLIWPPRGRKRLSGNHAP